MPGYGRVATSTERSRRVRCAHTPSLAGEMRMPMSPSFCTTMSMWSGRAHARELEHDPAARQLVAPGLDVAVGARELDAQGFEAALVHVDGSRAEVVAPRERDTGVAAAGQQGTEHHDRRAHLLDQLVR